MLETEAFKGILAERTKPSAKLMSNDHELNAWMRANVSTATHTSRSCHMGPDSDETAVVDQTCRVRGVEGLRVADTSVMPFLTSRGPSATAVMIGERTSAFFDN
jgi:choline dehydrogenase-like flavoprotein